MFDKLFNLFRKKPAAIQEELPPAPNPYTPSVKKVSTTSSCCSGKCGPRPIRSKRELKPVRERDLTPLLDSIEDVVYIMADTLSQRNYPEEIKGVPYEPNLPAEAPDPTPHHHSYDSPSHSSSYESHSSHSSYDSGSSHDSGGGYDSGGYDSGGYDSGGSCDSGGGGGCD